MSSASSARKEAAALTASRITTVVEGTNADLVAAFAALCIRPTDVVLDATWGRGRFWTKYRHPGRFIAHDLAVDGVDFTQSPEADGTVDVWVFDPPHIAPGGRATSTIPAFNGAYGLAAAPRTPAGVFDLYGAGMKEGSRLVRSGGLLAVKCMNGVTSGRKQWAHEHVVSTGRDLGLERWGELILVRPSPGPQPAHQRQVHAYNRHSFLCIFRSPRRRTT